MPSVDEYLAALPDPAQTVLGRVRAAVRRALPKAEESISYGIPTYKIDGKPVIYFAAWKKHFSVYPVSAQLLADLGIEREVDAKGTLKLDYDERAPGTLIARIVKARAKTPPAAKARSRRK